MVNFDIYELHQIWFWCTQLSRYWDFCFFYQNLFSRAIDSYFGLTSDPKPHKVGFDVN